MYARLRTRRYWPFELTCFHEDGARKEYIDGWDYDGEHIVPPNVHPAFDLEAGQLTGFHLDKSTVEREKYHSRGLGLPSNSKDMVKLVARIKPYVRDDANPRLYDFTRVFAIAIACARPHEAVDIKISRQSL